MIPHLHRSVCSDGSRPLWRCCRVGRCPHPRKQVKEKHGLCPETSWAAIWRSVDSVQLLDTFPLIVMVFLCIYCWSRCVRRAALSPALKTMNLPCVWAQKLQEYRTVEHLASEFSMRNNSLAQKTDGLMHFCSKEAKQNSSESLLLWTAVEKNKTVA